MNNVAKTSGKPGLLTVQKVEPKKRRVHEQRTINTGLQGN